MIYINIFVIFYIVPSQPMVLEAWRGALYGGHDTHVGGTDDRRRRRGIVDRARDLGKGCAGNGGNAGSKETIEPEMEVPSNKAIPSNNNIWNMEPNAKSPSK